MAELTPIARARVKTATATNPGDLASTRSAWRKSSRREFMAREAADGRRLEGPDPSRKACGQAGPAESLSHNFPIPGPSVSCWPARRLALQLQGTWLEGR